MTNHEIIRNAILNKSQVLAYYNGYYRELCPHVLGVKNSRTQALFYQFGGESSSAGVVVPGSEKNWRCIPIDELDIIEVINGREWYTAYNHSRPQTCVDEIEVEVNL